MDTGLQRQGTHTLLFCLPELILSLTLWYSSSSRGCEELRLSLVPLNHIITQPPFPPKKNIIIISHLFSPGLHTALLVHERKKRTPTHARVCAVPLILDYFVSPTLLNFISEVEQHKDAHYSRETNLTSLESGVASVDHRFNTSLIDAALDSEVAVLTPGLAPGVGDGPVGSAVLLTPADELDGVATELLVPELPPVALVDAGLVGEEGLVHGEGNLERAILHELSLDVGNGGEVERVGGLVLLPGLAVSALGSASGGDAGAGAVGEASVGHDTGAGEVVPERVEHATVATHVAGVAAHHILGRENGGGRVGGNGKAVGEDLRAAEREEEERERREMRKER